MPLSFEDQTTVMLTDDPPPHSKIDPLSDPSALQNEGLGLTAGKRLISPNHRFRDPWDAIIIITLVYTAIVTPFEVTFLEPSLSSPLFWLNRAVDLCFLCDMIVTLLTPVLREDTGVWITSHREIFREYARFWFWVDCISVVPFDAIALAMKENGDNNTQALRLFRLLRLIKLVRILKGSQILKRREAEMSWKYRTITLIKFVVMILVVAHWMACLMGLIPGLEGTTYDDLTPLQIANGTKPFNWIKIYFENGLGKTHGEYEIWSVYEAGYYCAVMTLTTIGYGDVVPKTDAERGVWILIMFTGAIVYAYAVGSICSILARMYEGHATFKKECDDFANFLDRKRFPPELKIRLKQYASFTWTREKAANHKQLLKLLSDSIQLEIYGVIARKWVVRVPFISQVMSPSNSGEYEGFIQGVASKFVFLAFPPNETLLKKSQLVTQMYLIERGMVMLHVSDHFASDRGFVSQPSAHPDRPSNVMFRKSIPALAFDEELTAGASFGAEMIVDNFESPYTATTLTYCNAYLLTRVDLDQVLENLPVTRSNLRKFAKRKNWEHFKMKMNSDMETTSSDPNEAYEDAAQKSLDVTQIIALNNELKDLHLRALALAEKLAWKEEWIAVGREGLQE